MYTAQHTHKDGARKYILLRSNTKLRLVCYRLSMPLYRTWAVTLKREPLPLLHSLSSLLLRNVFPPTPLLSFRYALRSHAFFRPFPHGLSATSVRSALCRRRPTFCRLRKSLYGPNQAPRNWYKKFDYFIQSVSFSKSDEDHCIFTKPDQDRSPIILMIYVDDMLVFGRHTGELGNCGRSLP